MLRPRRWRGREGLKLMDLGMSDDQGEMQASLKRFLLAEVPVSVVRDAEPLGFSAPLWSKFGALGLVGMTSSRASAAPGGSFLDAALVCEQLGRHLTPLPFIESMIAARTLERAGSALGGELVDDGQIGTVALRPAIRGMAELVPAGAIAELLVALEGDELIAFAEIPDAAVGGHYLGSVPVADRRLGGGARSQVIARGAEALAAHRCAVREWQILTAASLVGLAEGALDLGVAYVKERRQFGVPIGSFQTVSHRLVDCAISVEGARLLVREAAWAVDAAPADAEILAEMAIAYAAETAQHVAAESLHFHGGYGYMLEYDIQLFFTRSKAWPLVGGNPRHHYLVVGQDLIKPSSQGSILDFSLSADAQAFREEAREFAREHVTDVVVEEALRTGTMHNWDLHRALGRRGWIAAPWPCEDGGLAFSASKMLVLLEELHAQRAPFDGWAVTMSGANAVRDCGSEKIRREVLPSVVSGDCLIALGFSEPDSGSDVASARTRAYLDGETWVISGQKMFTTMAHEATWILLLTRTSAEESKHRGLTMFLVPTILDGIEVQPVRTLGGERTNITFYNDVRVGDQWRVGEVGGGWGVLTSSLNAERGSAFGAWPDFIGTSKKILDMSVAWSRRRAGAEHALGDAVDQEQIGRAAVGHEVARLLGHHSIWAAESGRNPGVEAAMAKVFVTETLQKSCSIMMDVMAEAGLRDTEDELAPMAGELERCFRHAAVTTIYGGSSEVLRGLIASQRLQLPRQ